MQEDYAAKVSLVDEKVEKLGIDILNLKVPRPKMIGAPQAEVKLCVKDIEIKHPPTLRELMDEQPGNDLVSNKFPCGAERSSRVRTKTLNAQRTEEGCFASIPNKSKSGPCLTAVNADKTANANDTLIVGTDDNDSNVRMTVDIGKNMTTPVRVPAFRRTCTPG